MKTKKILVIGSSGHAKVVIDIIEKEGCYNICGLIDDYADVGTYILGYEIIGKISDIQSLTSSLDVSIGLIAIGDNYNRYLVYKKIINNNFKFNFISIIHPTATIGKDVQIKEGTVIMPGAIINSSSQISPFCIINTNASIDHDCVMDKFSSLAPNVTVGGNTKIGKYTAICLGANIINRVEIGNKVVVGAGSLVMHDIPSLSLCYGSPAKVIRKRTIEEKYL